MSLIDLSHIINENIPLYPGTEPPQIQSVATIAKNGYNEKRFSFTNHTGTHIDAPAHMLSDGKTLDQYPAQKFTGQALVLNFGFPRASENEARYLRQMQSLIEQVDFVLIYTGWCRYWGTDRYFQDFPAISAESARWLAQFDLKGFGVDTASVDLMKSVDLPVHKIFFSKDMILVENLDFSRHIPEGIFRLFVFPLNVEAADGSPVRAVAETDSR